MQKKRSGRISNSSEDEELFKNIAINIEKFKIQKNISNMEIAENMGVSRQAISLLLKRLKCGEGIEIPTLRRLSVALEVKISDFF